MGDERSWVVTNSDDHPRRSWASGEGELAAPDSLNEELPLLESVGEYRATGQFTVPHVNRVTNSGDFYASVVAASARSVPGAVAAWQVGGVGQSVLRSDSKEHDLGKSARPPEYLSERADTECCFKPDES
jgi:hypothetical protein